MVSATIGIWVENGSRYERPAQNGVSHFIEHLLFKGTQQAHGRADRRGDSTPSAACSTRSPARNTPATTPRCSARTCRWPPTCSPIFSWTRSSTPTRSIASARWCCRRSRRPKTRPTITSTIFSTCNSGRAIRWPCRFSARSRPSTRSTASCWSPSWPTVTARAASLSRRPAKVDHERLVDECAAAVRRSLGRRHAASRSHRRVRPHRGHQP